MKAFEAKVESAGSRLSRNLLFLILAIIVLLIAAFLVLRPRGAYAGVPRAPAPQSEQAH